MASDHDIEHYSKKEIELSNEILEKLKDNDLQEIFHERPHYQKNRYNQWIQTAKRESTRETRIQTMINELQHGLYMRKPYPNHRKKGQKNEYENI